MSKAKSGGGIRSNKVVHSRGAKPGKAAKGVSPNIGTIGLQRVTTTGFKQSGVPNPISVPLGNEVAKNVGKGGPGAGRTVLPTGGQGRHGGKE